MKREKISQSLLLSSISPCRLFLFLVLITSVFSFSTDQYRNSDRFPLHRTLSKIQLQADGIDKSFVSTGQRSHRKSIFSNGLKAYSSSLLPDNMPLRNKDGIYDVLNEEQYRSLIQYSKEQNMLVVLKVFAPWCKACLKLAPKFVYFSKREEYRDFPILWAQLTCKDNKDLIEHVLVDLPHSSSLAGSQRKPKSAGIPSVQLYDGGKEIFTLPCPPSNLPTLKEKLKRYFENEYNAATRDMPDDGDADVVVLGETQWTRTRLFPNSPVIVRTSAPLSNRRLVDFVGDAVLAVSTTSTASRRDVTGGDEQPSRGWALEIHQPDDLSQPMTVSLELDLAEEYENYLKAFAMQDQQV